MEGTGRTTASTVGKSPGPARSASTLATQTSHGAPPRQPSSGPKQARTPNHDHRSLMTIWSQKGLENHPTASAWGQDQPERWGRNNPARTGRRSGVAWTRPTVVATCRACRGSARRRVTPSMPVIADGRVSAAVRASRWSWISCRCGSRPAVVAYSSRTCAVGHVIITQPSGDLIQNRTGSSENGRLRAWGISSHRVFSVINAALATYDLVGTGSNHRLRRVCVQRDATLGAGIDDLSYQTFG
jgi:hypothetical protein